MSDSPLDLSELMRAANRGDAAAYRQVLEGLALRLRGVVRSRLVRLGRGPEDTEDIVQDTLLAIHLKRHTWDERLPLEPWAWAIGHHKLVDALRRRGFHEHVALEDFADTLGTPAEAGGTRDDMTDLITRLPERQREIVQGISVEGRSAREMGERLGMSEGAVRVALHRAIRALAAEYKQGTP